jgi:hypothetical protein
MIPSPDMLPTHVFSVPETKSPTWSDDDISMIDETRHPEFIIKLDLAKSSLCGMMSNSSESAIPGNALHQSRRGIFICTKSRIIIIPPRPMGIYPIGMSFEDWEGRCRQRR